MTQKINVHVMWNFPVAIFSGLRRKIAKIMADRAKADERWLNG